MEATRRRGSPGRAGPGEARGAEALLSAQGGPPRIPPAAHTSSVPCACAAGRLRGLPNRCYDPPPRPTRPLRRPPHVTHHRGRAGLPHRRHTKSVPTHGPGAQSFAHTHTHSASLRCSAPVLLLSCLALSPAAARVPAALPTSRRRSRSRRFDALCEPAEPLPPKTDDESTRSAEAE